MKKVDDTDECMDQWKLEFLLSTNRKTSQDRRTIPPGPSLWSVSSKFMWPERDVKLKLVIFACKREVYAGGNALHMDILPETLFVGALSVPQQWGACRNSTLCAEGENLK